MRRVVAAFVAGAVLTASALANWSVTIIQSQGVLNPGSVVTNVPAVVINNPLPQVTFLTSAGTPNPILVGDGTNFTSGGYSAIYSIAPNPGPVGQLTGFNFVIAGFVQGNARINWQKKVVRNSDNAILYDESGTISGSGFGGADGAFSLTLTGVLGQPANDVTVYENFSLFVTGAPGQDTAALLLVQQDWVPEPASMLALGAGLAGLVGLRRRNR